MLSVKNLSQYRRPGFNPWVGKIPLEEGMATHTSILAWRIPWTEEPGGSYNARGRKVSDSTEQLSMHAVRYCI